MGEYDATLQFLGTRVSTLRKIDDGTLFPPTAPIAERSLVVLVVFKGGKERRERRKKEGRKGEENEIELLSKYSVLNKSF